ncbi:MAG: SGNH/GDSL hydrolase family protein [Clostridia bacterium]|nr:SGNH/GDSL hydrolase family protein [Clostridia bacterium]
MNKKNTIGIVVLLILAICLIFLAVLLFKPQDDTKPTIETPPEIPNKTDVVLPLTEDAGQEYIDKIYFVGESTTSHFFKGGIDRSHILVPSSATLTLGSDILQILVGDKQLTIPEAVKDVNAEILIITIGVNNAARFSEKEYKTFYGKLINAITQSSPSTKIILQSSFPVTAKYSNQGKAITNADIDRNNKWAKELAEQYSLKYLDTQSILKNDSGALIEEYSNGDGVHMNEKAYVAIIQYIRTHAIE